MARRINPHIKATILYLVIFLLPMESYAFEPIKNMPSRNAYFTGRASYLDKMQKKLLQHNIIYLTGYGGVGKTQLAKEYSYINEQKYDLIWWFDLRRDLMAQYENLLINLSNSKTFGNLLHVNTNNIAPTVLVDFTNSLLSGSKYKWLLIFDNVLNDKDIRLPKTKTAGQHIIITTREKRFLGDNAFALESFTNRESGTFLSKVHPKETKEEITKLYKALHNYPLALAQISEEILMYKNGIDAYFKRRNNFSAKPIPMHSDVTQEYNNNYHKVLNLTLQDIEQKDKESAKVLYMLALLNIELTAELLKDLFGDGVEEKIITLSQYGIIQTHSYKHSNILNIHDIIKEEAMKRLNEKDVTYKKDVVHILVEHFKDFYSKKDLRYLNGLDAANNQVAALYAYIDIALENNIINEGVINAVIMALRLNNILFNKHANPALYQQLTQKIYNKNLDNIAPNKKALLYASLILVNSVIYETEENLSKFEKEILHLLNSIENQKNHEELFFIYAHLTHFYLLLGNFTEAKKCAEKAKENINYADSIFSLLRYWYTNAWLCYELRDTDAGMIALDNYVKLSSNKFLSQVGKLFARDLKVKFMALLGQTEKAKKELEEIIKDAVIYYGDAPSGVVGELEYTKTLIYFQEGRHNLVEKQCHRALDILTKVFGGDIMDLTQAHIHIMLGEIYEEKGSYTHALEEYERVLKFYNGKSYGRVNNFYEYGELLSNFCFIYYKQKKYAESKTYYQKLVSNFGVDHDIVGKLIKKLPHEYMYQISGSDEK
ncbi:MAG: hypothetical protein ACD_21C00208G0003 [uncultured bacterium]|nr:MAG: hypothetical protein ACD_21C00208G0003 [uncultured bacterium]